MNETVGGEENRSDIGNSSREDSISDKDTSTGTESSQSTDLDSNARLYSEEGKICWREWCEFFHKREGKVNRRYVRCKVCTSYPSVVGSHSHRQRIPPIATAGGTRFREEVVSDHEKHQCHDAAVKAKRRSEIRKTDPLSVPLFAGVRHMEELFKKVGAYILMFTMMLKEGHYLHGVGHHGF